MKTLRASVCFPPALHTSIKMAIAGTPTVTLTAFVSRIIASSGRISDKALRAAYVALVGHEPRLRCAISGRRSTIIFDRDVAEAAAARAHDLDMSQSAFIVAAVAHKLSRNGQPWLND